MKKNKTASAPDAGENVPENLRYKPEDDIYVRAKRLNNIDPDDNAIMSQARGPESAMNQKDFEEDRSGEDLDIPGSELDDANESIGEEDEENNYYSIGGDNHGNLEEPRE